MHFVFLRTLQDTPLQFLNITSYYIHIHNNHNLIDKNKLTRPQTMKLDTSLLGPSRPWISTLLIKSSPYLHYNMICSFGILHFFLFKYFIQNIIMFAFLNFFFLF